MQIKYSPAQNGFFPSNIDYQTLPDDAFEITTELYNELLKGQSDGKIITPNGSKQPYLSEPIIDYEAAANAVKQAMRMLADDEINWRQDAVDAGFATEDETTALDTWKKYRVLLMRIDTSKAPDIDWPARPEPTIPV